MGLFSSSTPVPATPVPTSDGAFTAPDRTARDICWAARDAYFACLDRNGIVDSVKNKDEAQRVCASEGGRLDRDCVGSWVSASPSRHWWEAWREIFWEERERG